LPEVNYPATLNCAAELLDRHVGSGAGDNRAIITDAETWSYAGLLARSNQVAHTLVDDLGLVPGNRVLLRGPNNPWLVASWFGVIKAGGVAVTTMPLLRQRELQTMIEIADVRMAICDDRFVDDLNAAAPRGFQTVTYRSDGFASTKSAEFANVATAADDVCMLAFTSGTTGRPKATMHFHRDVMASCACFPPHVLRANADDVFIGSPPLAFTFGLGGLTLFPMAIGAQTVLIEKPAPAELLDAIVAERATVLFTAPTSYRAMAQAAKERKVSVRDGGALRKCVAAGEALPAATRALWRDATGIEIIDGIGATEMLHIFIAADEAHARPGATGTAVPGYRARVVDDDGNEVPPGTIGRLAVQGPTGCRYLDDARQADYVRRGWNY
ncbi:MAG TPA: AMP-binding protein, partial [Caldimonas sp.]|nr:AMP-binding protein [Caldimonas sp.]